MPNVEGPTHGAGGRRLHLLLVEDHAGTAGVMQRLLEAYGFEVRTAQCYIDALAAAAQWIPDILISDIGLPDKDGIEVMKIMRQAYPGLRGIVVSGYVRAEDEERSRTAGFSEFLCKPVDVERLVAAIHGLFRSAPAEGGE
jgi:CheY-like chemotaxis protein